MKNITTVDICLPHTLMGRGEGIQKGGGVGVLCLYYGASQQFFNFGSLGKSGISTLMLALMLLHWGASGLMHLCIFAQRVM